MQQEEYGRLFEHEDTYWWYVGRRRLALGLLDRCRRVKGPLLDLGCGTGAVLSELEHRDIAIGADASILALAFCRKRGLEHLILADAERAPIRDSSLAGIVALDIFEHVENDQRAMKEAYRILAPGGILVLSVPAFRSLWGPHDVALMHFRRYRSTELRTRLVEAGFEIDKLSYSVFYLFPAVVIVRLLDKLRRGSPKVSLPRIPQWMNRMLIRIQDFEASCINQFGLPWGSSVVAVARKPERN